jgi:anthranilate synthase component 1
VAWLGNYTRFAVFDHVKQEVSLCNANSDSDDALHEWAERLRGPMPIVASSCSWGDRRSSVTQSDFCASVDCFKEHIRKGDIFQGVLSQKFSRAFDGDAFQLYRALRRVNPSPFMFYHETPVGTFVERRRNFRRGIRAREVRIDPIAGTRPRGNDETEDVKNEQGLESGQEGACRAHDAG